VASYPHNQYGLHDLYGNVWEWVQDSWHADYKGAPTDGAARNTAGNWRVLRGGSFAVNQSMISPSTRVGNPASVRFSTVGFRLAEDIVCD